MKLNKTEKSWVLYDWANSAYSMTVTSTILPLYFKMITDNAGIEKNISTAYWGYANSLGTLLLAILAPILGTIADYRGYKKRFFRFFFMMGVLSTALLAVPKDAWLALLVIYFITLIGFSGANIFYDAFLVDVTDEDRMDRVSTMGYALGYIGSTIPFIICIAIIILAQFNKIPLNVETASRISFIITAVWWGVFTIPMLKNVKQIHFVEIEKNPVVSSFRRIYKTFKEIKKHKTIFVFLIAYFFYIDGVDTIIKMATAYGSDLGISSTSLLIILLATQFVAFPFAILYGKLAEKYTGKFMLFVAIGVYVIICIYAYFIKTALDFWILAMLVGTSQGGIQALSRSYFGKLVPKENSNEFFGFYNIFGKFAAIMGPFLVGIVAQLTGKTNNGVFSIIVLFIIGGFMLVKVPVNRTEDSSLNI
ncbi:Vacuole effluxer Atg22 like protein [Caloramator mitchellensis]|uniref:Vacuole effluxer Atg22 like protein n=1 Tax=Caloramator mitchellensis TaxID=908809 RepID=A0A0R3JTQ6_CALMK|nr:MFS transporter [Caloramator mitchellensis]KRQ86905.1 Vacuole effluxer Atg22 like protein [Caloramator mitchellensis]